MKQLNEVKRMQLLAGLITESQLSEIKSFTPEDDINFKWKSQPANPKSILTDTDSGEEFTKASYWESDIIGTDPLDIFPAYGSENSDGTWTLTFDEGEFSGFVEGEDFTFGDEETNNLNEAEENEIEVAFQASPKMVPWNTIEKTYMESGLTGEEFFADVEDEFRSEFENKSVSRDAYYKFFTKRFIEGQDNLYTMVNWINLTDPKLADELYNMI